MVVFIEVTPIGQNGPAYVNLDDIRLIEREGPSHTVLRFRGREDPTFVVAQEDYARVKQLVRQALAPDTAVGTYAATNS